MGGRGAKWKLLCSLGVGWNITCRGIAALFRRSAARCRRKVRRWRVGTSRRSSARARRRVRISGVRGEGLQGDSNGIGGWPSPPEWSSACGRACSRGRNCPSAAETSGRRSSSWSALGRDTVPAKAVLEHLVCPSASAPGRGTMPAKASLGASRVSASALAGERASRVVSRVRPRALGWPKSGPVCYGWTQAWSTRCGKRGPYALRRR